MIGLKGGSFRWGRVSLVYSHGGVPVADVVDSEGALWTRVRFLVMGGGAGQFAYFPPALETDPTAVLPSLGEGAEVALFFSTRSAGRPWIFGALLHPRSAAQFLDVVPFSAETDYPANGVRDHVIENGGAALILSSLAGPVLKADVGRSIRAQLATGGALRISINGEALEGVLLAGPTLAYLDALTLRVNALQVALAEILAWGLTVSPPLAPSPSMVATGAAPPLPLTTKALESAAIKISAVSKVVP